MTIEEYKKAFLKLFEDMQNEHGLAEYVRVGRKPNPLYKEGAASGGLISEPFMAEVKIEF